MRIRSPRPVTLVLALVALAVPATASAASGDLDPTFGTGGGTVTQVGSGSDEANAIALQADGKIVVAGYTDPGTKTFAVARYNTDGTLDATFGTGGTVITNVGSGINVAQAVAVQTDGKILVAGYASNGSDEDFALVRYNANGTVDTTFGTSGIRLTDFAGGSDRASAITLQPDGKIVLVGNALVSGTSDFGIARYSSTGTLDPTFGTAGTKSVALGTTTDIATAVALQGDGSIVVAGETGQGMSGNYDFGVVRLTASGTLDAAFGTGGIQVTSIGPDSDFPGGVAIQGDGKIVVTGHTQTYAGGPLDLALVRYGASGALDSTFGTAGIQTTDLVGDSDFNGGVRLQADGKILLVGYTNDGSTNVIALERYDTSGALDASFGTGGKVLARYAPLRNSQAYALALDASGQIVVAGSALTSGVFNFAVARFLVAPAVASVTVPANGTYVAGQTLDFTAHFSAPVTVSTASGTPTIPVTLDTGGTVQAVYTAGSGTAALTFRYVIASGDADANGVTLGSAIVLHGGTIANTEGAADLTLHNVGSTSDVLVGAPAPTGTTPTTGGGAGGTTPTGSTTPAPTPAAPTTPAVPVDVVAPPSSYVAPSSITVASDGSFPAKLTCPVTEKVCSVKLVLNTSFRYHTFSGHGRTKLVKVVVDARYTVLGGTTRTVKLRLPVSVRAALVRSAATGKPLRAVLRESTTDGRGNVTRLKRIVLLRLHRAA